MAAASAASQVSSEQLKDLWALLELWLGAQQRYDRLPSLTAAVVVGEELMWKRSWGMADREAARPARPDTLYSICSISKLFTSVAVMQLWEQGRLGLDDDVGRILPEFQGLQRSDPDSGPITVRGLLTHSAGVPREGGHSYWPWPRHDFPDRARLYQALRQQSTERRAGERFAYSNLGMALLGDVVAKVSGMPYEDYVRRHLLAPLGMSSTLPSLGVGLPAERMATGYSLLSRDGQREPMAGFDTGALRAAAGYSSTVEDLARFAAWQFRLLRQGGQELLKVATLREMQRVQWTDPSGRLTWGLGFAVQRDGADTVVGHDGTCPGYRSVLSLLPAERVAAVTLVNSLGPFGSGGETVYTRGIRRLVQKALKLRQAAATASASAASAEKAAAPELADYVGRYPFASDDVVIRWGKDLALLRLPSQDPAAEMMLLRHKSGDRFEMVDEEGAFLTEVLFERDASAKVVALRLSSQRVRRVE